jgi:hypothetical protein
MQYGNEVREKKENENLVRFCAQFLLNRQLKDEARQRHRKSLLNIDENENFA